MGDWFALSVGATGRCYLTNMNRALYPRRTVYPQEASSLAPEGTLGLNDNFTDCFPVDQASECIRSLF